MKHNSKGKVLLWANILLTDQETSLKNKEGGRELWEVVDGSDFTGVYFLGLQTHQIVYSKYVQPLAGQSDLNKVVLEKKRKETEASQCRDYSISWQVSLECQGSALDAQPGSFP